MNQTIRELAPRSTKPKLREMQKAMTLGMIKDAAREIFSSGQYDSVSVDDIAKQAGVSRGTVYMHFKTKVDILVALVNDDLATHLACYEDLARIDDPTIADIMLWIRKFIDSTKSSNGFLTVFFRYNSSDNFSMVMEHRERVVEALGRRYPGFNISGEASASSERKLAQCYMMLYLIENGSITYSADSTFPNRDVGLGMLADILLKFLLSGEIHSVA